MTHIAGKQTTYDDSHTMEEHVHKPQEVYPASASSVQLTAGTGSAWDHGTKVQVIAADAIDKPFDVHWVLISALSVNAEYEIILYSGAPASEVEIGRVASVRNAVMSVEGSLPMMTEVQPKGTRISASLASSTGTADTANIKLFAHRY